MAKASQLRAARALLNITIQEVSDATGIGKMTLSDTENEKTKPKAGTIDSLQRFYESRGVEFGLDGSIRPLANSVQLYEGPNCYMDFMNEAHSYLSHHKGEILFTGADERRSPPAVVEKFRAMRADGVTMRSLIRPGDDFIMGAPDEYRWMPEDLFVEGDVQIVFADRVAFLASWLDVPRVIMIKDPTIAQSALRTFEYLWRNAQGPQTSSAPEGY